jgi:endonuclease III
MWTNAQLALRLDASDETPLLVRIRDRLREVFGPQRDEERFDPLTQLVLTMVSSRTPDDVGLAALQRLCRRYTSVEALAHATPGAIDTIIRPVTRAEEKARDLSRALRKIHARNGRWNLDFLEALPEEMAMRWLMDLPGVGSHNAATVLNFSTLRKRVFSVDTHIIRVGQRLNLLPRTASFERGFETFMRLIPADWNADDLYELHWLIKLHGQHTCTHDDPYCPGCPLRDMCFPPATRAQPDCRKMEAPLLSGA